jgi:hypothetical protein
LIDRRVPALSRRSNRRSLISDSEDERPANRCDGQLAPRHRTATFTSLGTRTVNSVIRAPVGVSSPRIRTTGNGSSSGGRTEAGVTAGGTGAGMTLGVEVGFGVGVDVDVDGVGVGVGDGGGGGGAAWTTAVSSE